MILDQIKTTSKVSYVPFTNVFRKYKGLTAMEKMIYMSLWYMAGEKSYCFPAVKTLADELMISESTVKRNLKILDEKHCIYTISQKHKDTGRQLSNLYYVIEFNPHEGKFNEDYYKVLERLHPTRIRYLEDDEIKTFKQKKKAILRQQGQLPK